MKSKKTREPRYVYTFGGGKAQGDASMRNLLGGKGANLAEMSRIGLPVPAGFTLSTECCNDYFDRGRKLPPSLKKQVVDALKKTERIMKMNYGDAENPLLVSCRSGARGSMPGMMETVLNVGLCDATIPGLIARTGNPRFVWDAYRRLIMMYSDVVMEKAEDVEPEEGQGIRRQLDDMLSRVKEKNGYRLDTDLGVEDLRELTHAFKKRVRDVLGREFPADPLDQLWGAISAVFRSWNGRRAVAYRKYEAIPGDWGTAVTVQSMVFGNMGDSSATGVAFTRNPATGADLFYGEWLVNAQGEDVVAGTRTPNPLNDQMREEQQSLLPSLEEKMPRAFKELCEVREKLERHYRDMQDIEFTIQEGRLYILQCRSGKRSGPAAVAMAMDMLHERLIEASTAVLRVAPDHLDQLLHPFIDPAAEKECEPVAAGLPAGPGGSVGEIVFTSKAAMRKVQEGVKVILVREETNPEDIEGMRAASGILTARGGMTSHAALVARGWGKSCVVGAERITVDAGAGRMRVGDLCYHEGDVMTLNGTKGLVYAGALPMVNATENPRFRSFMKLVDRFRTMGVRTNADTPEDAGVGRDFGAEGIGLFRTEHMFYGESGDQPLFLLRKVILSATVEQRREALDELFPFVKRDIKATLAAMNGLPVTVRLLDPPLHEFVPHRLEKQQELADALGIDVAEVIRRGEELRENNPMMGHRGVRLGITYPEITEMQARAVFEASIELASKGCKCRPEIMIPVVCDPNELAHQKKRIEAVHKAVCAENGIRRVWHKIGTMIEIPRACLLAAKMAGEADFFSFGTNDLTQMTFGFSRDDIGGFLPAYLDNKIVVADPFRTLDEAGVGRLIELAVDEGRKARPNLKSGLCGEHGGDPDSVRFCLAAGLDYVSCSPYRVPIARLAAAHAAIEAGADGTEKETKSTP